MELWLQISIYAIGGIIIWTASYYGTKHQIKKYFDKLRKDNDK